MDNALHNVRALVFDVFGTVVDWRSSVIDELAQLGNSKGLDRDWPRFADAWRKDYGERTRRINDGLDEWMLVDEIHRRKLDSLLEEFNVSGLTCAEVDRLSQVWHRLRPWPDSVAGLTRLKSGYVIATLSNGNVGLLVNMAKFGGLPWDCILSSQLFGKYKPHPSVYQGAARLLGLRPEQVALVAAHTGDLEGARAAGLRTILVPRPDEYGPGKDAGPGVADRPFDLVAASFVDLANTLTA